MCVCVYTHIYTHTAIYINIKCACMYLVILVTADYSSVFVHWKSRGSCFCENPATVDKKMDLPDTFFVI